VAPVEPVPPVLPTVSASELPAIPDDEPETEIVQPQQSTPEEKQ
jgi:hypothetical protein